MPKIAPLVDTRIVRPAEAALALDMVTENDLLRLKAIARLHARGLPPDVGWEDLLQEALTRVLVGDRKIPHGVTMVAFIAGVMRSLKSAHWRRTLNGQRTKDAYQALDRGIEDNQYQLPDTRPGPERALVARQALEEIQRVFAGDPVVQRILTGLAEGLTPESIRANFRISKTEYDSARKRLRRRLLREGLTCERT